MDNDVLYDVSTVYICNQRTERLVKSLLLTLDCRKQKRKIGKKVLTEKHAEWLTVFSFYLLVKQAVWTLLQMKLLCMQKSQGVIQIWLVLMHLVMTSDQR